MHATVVAIGQWGVALIGPSGSGKSDLALRLIDRGAQLVGDDYVVVLNERNVPMACAAAELAGKIEIRGIGIVPIDYRDHAPLRLCVILGEEAERMPETSPFHTMAGFDIPSLKLNAFAASAPVVIEIALQTVVDAGQWPVSHLHDNHL